MRHGIKDDASCSMNDGSGASPGAAGCAHGAAVVVIFGRMSMQVKFDQHVRHGCIHAWHDADSALDAMWTAAQTVHIESDCLSAVLHLWTPGASAHVQRL